VRQAVTATGPDSLEHLAVLVVKIVSTATLKLTPSIVR
jgi:hypothetical protein